jgi:hypothetical protein
VGSLFFLILKQRKAIDAMLNKMKERKSFSCSVVRTLLYVAGVCLCNSVSKQSASGFIQFHFHYNRVQSSSREINTVWALYIHGRCRLAEHCTTRIVYLRLLSLTRLTEFESFDFTIIRLVTKSRYSHPKRINTLSYYPPENVWSSAWWSWEEVIARKKSTVEWNIIMRGLMDIRKP